MALHTLGVPSTMFFAMNAADTPSGDTFVVIRWEEKTAEFDTRGSQFMSVWVHDKSRSYDTINAVLKRVTELITSAVHLVGADGFTLTQATYTGESSDLYDDGFHTVVRYHSYRVSSRLS
jgi:hypothetical protein